MARLPRTLHRRLILAQINQRRRQPRPIRDARKQQLGRLVQLVLKALLADLEDVRDVRHREKVLHVVQPVRLRVRVRELRVDLGLAQRLARHLQEAHEVVVLVGVPCDFDDLGEVGGVFGFDV